MRPLAFLRGSEWGSRIGRLSRSATRIAKQFGPDLLHDLPSLAGFACVLWGLHFWSVPLTWIVAGIGLIVIVRE